MTAHGVPTWGLGPFVREDSANPILSPRGESRFAGTEVPFFLPERDYERTGQCAAGTTFLEGLAALGGRWLLYYGTADSHVAVAASREVREGR